MVLAQNQPPSHTGLLGMDLCKFLGKRDPFRGHVGFPTKTFNTPLQHKKLSNQNRTPVLPYVAPAGQDLLLVWGEIPDT